MSPEDRIVSVLSHWLARHLSDDDLSRELAEADASRLGTEEQEAVQELCEELRRANGRGDLERVVRETLEAVALGS